MAEDNKNQKTVIIQDELKEAYLDYGMSVIVGRALPDIRDGLKPVHRRILFSMHEMGLTHNRPFVKSARIVGECFKYHPHGDAALYESLVRMVQDFSLRYPLITGHGNFGCFTGDTKIKLLNGTSKSFKELCEIYKNGEIFYVYSIDKEGKIVVGEAITPRITRKNAELVEVTLDTGEKIRCTPNHKFLLKNLGYKEAKDLTPEDSLMPGYFKLSPIKGNTELKDYLMIKDNKTDKYNFVHGIADEYNLTKGNYFIADGDVRHHIDFNKFNNDPENIRRLSWKEHTGIHNKHIKSLWKNKEFRIKQAQGVKNFYKNNPHHIEKLRKMLTERNKNVKFIKKNTEKRKQIWQNQELREINSIKLKENFKIHPERKKFISEISKKMWANSEKRKEIINKMKESVTPERRANHSKVQRARIINNPGIREEVSKRFKELYKNEPDRKKIISERNKILWEDKKYKSKFVNDDYNHFSSMAKKAWQNEDYKNLQVNKIKKLWDKDSFRNNLINSVRKSNIKRLKDNPHMMNQLAKKAAIAHKINWKNPEYKNKIIKNKVLYYVNRLIYKIGEEKINESTYNTNRINNASPRFENAIKYFKNINEMISLAKEYNHHVVSVKFLNYTEDVYDLTVGIHHNFLLDCGVFVHNSIDFAQPAQMRYTEAKLNKLSEEILADIDKDTVDFIPNFDGSLKEPIVLPSKIPNLLINGSVGIAVGMATNIPPHNVSEICDAMIALIDNPEIDDLSLMSNVKGPDFPTGAQILGTASIKQAYKTGRGKLTIRAKCTIEDRTIIINEIPYQVDKSGLIESIAELVTDKIVEGISDIRDESDKSGTRILIELKKAADPNIVLNQLYKHSQLQITFGIINLALVNGEPRVLSLKEMCYEFVKHRKEVVTRRTQFELKKAEDRDHILQGLLTALKSIDQIIALIKSSKDVESAKNGLINNYILTEIQANAILEMKLSRLAALEQQKILNEHNELLKFIQEMKNILASEIRIFKIIKDELVGIKNEYSDKRKTEIIESEEEILETEDLIEKEVVVITITHSGYLKRQLLDVYKSQRRGGKGVIGTETKDDTDFVENLFVANTHSYILFFTDKGMVHWLKAYQIPDAGRYAKGSAIVNLIKLDKDEKVTSMVAVNEFKEDNYLVMATKNGVIKKTSLVEYSRPRQGGIIGINLRENDKLIDVRMTDGSKQIIIATKDGRAVRFKESDINSVGRNSVGVRGINVKKSEVVGMEIVSAPYLLTVTEKGYGKRSEVNDYRLINRGGSGVTNIKITEKNGKVVSIKVVNEADEIMLISKNGVIIRTPVSGISVVGRNTQGVRIMNLDESDRLATVARIINDEVVLEKKEEFKPDENGDNKDTSSAENSAESEINDKELEAEVEADEIKEELTEEKEISEEKNLESENIETNENKDLNEKEVKEFLEKNNLEKDADNSEEKQSKKDFTLDGYEDDK